ncbi:MAG TPA: trimethylamine methyltransferase family protein [Anaerolineales bacterium]|nr:trimethylamine methyltransferase family protein [Anaerolineales bacterium]
MRFTAQILSDDEQYRIHKMSLRILEEVGIRVHGDLAPKILRDHGVKFNPEDKLAKIPAEFVEQALKTAPKSFILGARNPKYNFQVPAEYTRYGLDGTAAFALDFTSGERRYGTSKDIENALQIFQQMDMGVMAWAPTCAEDIPANIRALYEFLSMARLSSKHGEHELHRVEQVPYLEEGLVAIMGSQEALRKSHAYSLIYCPVAPLTHDGQMLDAYLELGELDLPVMVMPMPVNGTTGPASLYSNIALANAETLSSLVIFQLAHPGRPMIFSSSTATIDFRSGAYLAGVPEMALQTAGLAVMGKYYGFPTSGAGFTADANQAGPEAVMEKFITTLPSVLAGADLLIGFGEIASDQLLILEQIVVDNEIAHIIQRMVEGVDCTDEKDLFEDIAKIGPGGHFLATKSTRKAARSAEFLTTQLVDHHSYETWVELGKPSMYAKAREIVEEILSQPVVDPLPEEVEAKLDQILKKAEKKLNA